jgi:hypothetical protein
MNSQEKLHEVTNRLLAFGLSPEQAEIVLRLVRDYVVAFIDEEFAILNR